MAVPDEAFAGMLRFYQDSCAVATCATQSLVTSAIIMFTSTFCRAMTKKRLQGLEILSSLHSSGRRRRRDYFGRTRNLEKAEARLFS